MARSHTRKPWSEDEISTLRARYSDDGPSALAREMGRSFCSVEAKAKKLGVRSIPNWSEEERARIPEALSRIESAITEVLPGRSAVAVVWMAAHIARQASARSKGSKAPPRA